MDFSRFLEDRAIEIQMEIDRKKQQMVELLNEIKKLKRDLDKVKRVGVKTQELAEQLGCANE